ncbi:taurine ABC transporter substrate-binding protein [Bordetella genomosp. 10]|uniref:Taurine ABC transporter substrate-binding protein n=1 Tax=Bordetella genomosp. 10 TaxID=1416804 RepID=A0A261S1G6_9BORD|nr:glycine betaine ABC transporter substrate-binding protein [Bordetella genomosp. 10]OZI31176.1 taurine ABC transporter substrate-binding protein [Bordetella genomosp. 10]
MKALFRTLLLAGVAAIATPAHSAEPLPKEVRIAYSGGAQLIVNAKVDGSLEKALGVPVKWVQFGTGADVLNLFASNSIDIANFGSSPTISAIVRKLPIELVGISADIATYERLVARQSKNIDTLNDLAGHTVGYPANSTAQYALDTAIALNHIDRSKIRFVPLKPDELVAAWRRGDVDAGYVWAPFNSTLEQNGGHAIFYTRDLKKDGYLIFNGLSVSRAFGRQHPELVAKLLVVLEQEVRNYRKDPTGVAEAIAKELGSTPQAVRESIDGNNYPTIAEQLQPAWFGDGSHPDQTVLAGAARKTAEFLGSIDQIRKQDIPASFSDAINPAYLKLALRLQQAADAPAGAAR